MKFGIYSERQTILSEYSVARAIFVLVFRSISTLVLSLLVSIIPTCVHIFIFFTLLYYFETVYIDRGPWCGPIHVQLFHCTRMMILDLNDGPMSIFTNYRKADKRKYYSYSPLLIS